MEQKDGMVGMAQRGIKCKKRISVLKDIENDEILFLKSLLNYTEIHTNNKRIVSGYTLKHLVEYLKDIDFIAVNRGLSVNKNHIKSVINNELTLKNEVKLKLSRRKIKQCHLQIHIQA
jgi:DNA-binding LytR/AlgR family response regulator